MVLCGKSQSQKTAKPHAAVATDSENRSNAEKNPLLFLPTASVRAILARRNPKRATREKERKRSHESTAPVDTVAAPPRRRLTVVMTTSATKSDPPEHPTSWPARKSTMTRVCDPVVLNPEEKDSVPISMDCMVVLKPNATLE